MAKKVMKLDTDVVIAGGGPGGCTIAKELSKKGKEVVLIDKGRNDNRLFGTIFGTMTHIQMEKSYNIIQRTLEGDDLILGVGVGGGTLIYAGSAFLPDMNFWNKWGIDIPQDIVDESVKECWRSGHCPYFETLGIG